MKFVPLKQFKYQIMLIILINYLKIHATALLKLAVHLSRISDMPT